MLTVTDLGCARGGLPVLQDVSFDLAAGEALVLRGPNGCGKTTLLRTLAGLQPAQAGTVSCVPDSIAYSGHSDGIKAMLGVAENLEFWAGVYGGGNINDALQAYEIESLRDRRAQDLSAGQKRRLGLARLLVTRRPVWLLDEPTVSLDIASVALFAASVRRHLAAGGAALIATHVDLGLEARDLDVSAFRARRDAGRAFDVAFS